MIKKDDDGWSNDKNVVTLSQKEARKKNVENSDQSEDEDEVKLSILKRKCNSNGLNQDKLAELKKKITRLDSGMQDAQNEMKSQKTLLEKMQKGIAHKFRKHESDLRDEMSLFNLELQPAHQIAQRGQRFVEDELDLFGISDRDLKKDKDLAENTDFDNEIVNRMETFQSQLPSHKMKEKLVICQNDHRPELSPIDDKNQQQP